MNLTRRLNHSLDKLVRPAARIGGRSWNAFNLCGSIGVAAAVALALSLTMRMGLSAAVTVGIIASAIVTFFVVILITKIVVGEERIIYYHHEIAVVAAAALFLWMLDQPVLPYLDITILCIGIFLSCGRIGCLMVGCCHGAPHAWGVCYRAEDGAPGVSPLYIGVRLFPIQAVESVYVLGIVLVGCAFVLDGRTPGDALAWYTVAYSLGRFCFEFLRGDPDRPYYGAFSQPQWISLLLIGAVIWAELNGAIGFHLWHFGVTALMGATAIAVALRSLPKGITKHKLFHPHHIYEVAGALQLASDLALERCDICKQISAPANIHIGCTSLGVQISASRITRLTDYLYHYTVSCQNETMSEETAGLLANFILKVRHSSDASAAVSGRQGVFHLMVCARNAEK